jgi:hypothetical protein
MYKEGRQYVLDAKAEVEGVLVFWCGAENNWKEAPARPEGNYKFDFFEWQWVLI